MDIFSNEEMPVQCVSKIQAIGCAFRKAIDNRGDLLIQRSDDPQNATLLRMYTYWAGRNQKGHSEVAVCIAQNCESICMTLDTAKEFLEHLTALINSADAIEDKYLKALEEARKEQQESVKNDTVNFEF